MEYKVINADILEWAKEYKGEKFHAILCDPPYGLEFMGKEWDRLDGWCDGGSQSRSAERSNAMQNTYFEWFSAIHGHLLPGAHLLVFGGTRTHHRLACALEDAGFEIRDTIMCWSYGCLSEDTEILTINGWEHYSKSIDKHPVLCYNIDKDAFEFHKPKRSFIYKNEYPAYRIQSDNTDQLVSRNHRVLVERGGRKVFCYAEALQCQETIPFLESLHDLPETIPCVDEGASIKKQDLLFRVLQIESSKAQTASEGVASSSQANGSAQNDIDSLPMWQKDLETKCMGSESQTAVLQYALQSKIHYGSDFNRQQVRQNGNEISRNGTERGSQSGVERWSDLFQDTWKLCWHEIRAVSKRIFGNGSERWLRYGTSLAGSSAVGAVIVENGSGPSRGPRPDKQQPGSAAICQQSGSQIVRSGASYKTTLARVYQERYDGNVWCVEVPTGAFVVRRNGKIFITGNSGFPKSLNVGKAMDKGAGVERKDLGANPNLIGRTKDMRGNRYMNTILSDMENVGHITVPATDAAKIWDGYGTALKPAVEPIIVARKPLEGTVAQNCLKHGAGALNIDAGRIGSSSTPRLNTTNTTNAHEGYQRPGKSMFTDHLEFTGKQGRWPANFILMHSPDCVLRGNKKVKGHAGYPNGPGGLWSKEYQKNSEIAKAWNSASTKKDNEPWEGYADPDGTETVEDWDCVEDCPVRKLDEQSGILKSGMVKQWQDGGKFTVFGKQSPRYVETIGDSGGASRFFHQVSEQLDEADPIQYCAKASRGERDAGCEKMLKELPQIYGKMEGTEQHAPNRQFEHHNHHPTVKPIDLNRYLATLLLPPKECAPRRILVPFAGSGSEMIGAMQAGWDEIVGVEREMEYCELAEARLAYWKYRRPTDPKPKQTKQETGKEQLTLL